MYLVKGIAEQFCNEAATDPAPAQSQTRHSFKRAITVQATAMSRRRRVWRTPARCRTRYSFRLESIVQATRVLHIKVLLLVFLFLICRSILVCRRIFVVPQRVRIFQQRLHFSFSSARSYSLACLPRILQISSKEVIMHLLFTHRLAFHLQCQTVYS